MSDGKCKNVLDKLFDCVNNVSFWIIFLWLVSSGVGWNVVQIKSACPSRKKKHAEESGESKAPLERDLDDVTPSTDSKKSPYIAPSQICPPSKSCCFIKMQDPCAPCCCEMKLKSPPCPSKHHAQEPREPICGCDLCKKKNGNPKCCDRNSTPRGIHIDPRYFEKI